MAIESYRDYRTLDGKGCVDQFSIENSIFYFFFSFIALLFTGVLRISTLPLQRSFQSIFDIWRKISLTMCFRDGTFLFGIGLIWKKSKRQENTVEFWRDFFFPTRILKTRLGNTAARHHIPRCEYRKKQPETSQVEDCHTSSFLWLCCAPVSGEIKKDAEGKSSYSTYFRNVQCPQCLLI